MSRFLFLLWDGGGNVPPQLGIVRRLVARGHAVRVLAEPSLQPEVASAGASFVSLSAAPHRFDRTPSSDFVRDWEARTPIGEFGRARDRVMIGPARLYADDVLAELRREPADVLAVDWLLFGGALAGESAQVPTALICHNPWMVPEPGRPAPGFGFTPAGGAVGRARDIVGNRLFTGMFDRALPAVNAARRELGLAELDTVPALFDRVERVLVLTEDRFDFLPRARAANVVHVGPVLDGPAGVSPWTSPWPPDDPRPLVLVTTSSYFQDPREMLHNACAAVRRLGARAAVTTGAIDPATLPPGVDVLAARTLPHDQGMQQAHAVVTHCGLGTVHRALGFGLPVLCQPIGRDQPDVAARVVAAGAGLRLAPKARVRRVVHALDRLLSDPAYAERARATGARLRATAEREQYVTELEMLASRREHPRAADTERT
jgi:UDP:flavonoid glycosyltransferase YjiC (YdhE family)